MEVTVAEFHYDADCRSCTDWARLLNRISRRWVRVVPLQGYIPADPRLSEEELRREAKLVLDDGTVFGGAEAIAQAIGGPALVYYVPGIRQLADRLYARAAASRCRVAGDRT